MGCARISSPPLPTDSSATFVKSDAACCDDESFHVLCFGGPYEDVLHNRHCSVRPKYHRRGTVCTKGKRFVKCNSCTNVVHEGCWAKDAKGGFEFPFSLPQWTCAACSSSQQITQITTSVPASQSDQTTPLKSLSSTILKQSATCPPFFSSVKFGTIRQLKTEMRKSGWKLRSSNSTTKHLKVYFHCGLINPENQEKGCQITFKATCLLPSSSDPTGATTEWTVHHQPSSHSCCPPDHVKQEARTGILDKMVDVPEEVLKEITKLGQKKRFDSKAIQMHIFDEYKILVSVELIYNVGYRARQAVFGETADTTQLRLQQEKRRQQGDIYELIYTDDGKGSQLK
jgi:hypothetical protein